MKSKLLWILFIPSYTGLIIAWLWTAFINLCLMPFYKLDNKWDVYVEGLKEEWERLFDF